RDFSALYFYDTVTTQTYTLSLHDALPISLIDLQEGFLIQHLIDFRSILNFFRAIGELEGALSFLPMQGARGDRTDDGGLGIPSRSEEHTSELQSRENLVCRLLLEKKKETK